MRFGRDSFILVILPLCFLGAAFVLLFSGEEGTSDSTVRFARDGVSLAETATEAPSAMRDLIPLRMPTPHVRAQDNATQRNENDATGRASGFVDPDLDPALPDPVRGEPATGRGRAPAPQRRRKPFKGTVQDSNGAPLSGAHIEVREKRNLFSRDLGNSSREFVVQRLQADRNGEFSFARGEGRVYDLFITAAGMAPMTVRPYGGARPVFEMAPAASVSGFVSDSRDGAPVPGVRVRLIGDGVVRDAVTSASGTYTFDPTPIGWSSLEFSHQGFLPQRRRIHLQGGESHIENVSLEPGVTLQGTVIDGLSSLPVEGAQVTVFDRFQLLEVASVTTGPGGFFEVSSLQPGSHYGVRAVQEGFSETTEWLELESSGLPAPITLTLQPTWELKGRVLDPDRSLVDDAAIEAFVDEGAGPRFFVRVVTDEMGRFCIGDLPADGVVELFVIPTRHAATARRGLTRETAGTRFLEIVLDPMGVVEGVITATGGAPQSGVLVRATAEIEAQGQTQVIHLFTYTDEGGSYRLQSLPVGQVILKTIHAGFLNETRSLNVLPQTTVRSDLVLTPFPRSSEPR